MLFPQKAALGEAQYPKGDLNPSHHHWWGLRVSRPLEALLDNFLSHLCFSPLLSDCAQVCWHLQPVPAVGPEQTVERASLRGVLPARSAPSPPARRHGVQQDRGLTLAGSVQPFALKSPSRTSSCRDTLPHLERKAEQRSSEDLLDPAALLAGGRQSCAVPQLLNFAEEPTAWFLAENPPAVVSSCDLKRRQHHTASNCILSHFSDSHNSYRRLSLCVSQIWHTLLHRNAEKEFKFSSQRSKLP